MGLFVIMPLLADIFKKGVGTFSKEELTKALAQARTKLFRFDRYAPELIEKGFQKDLVKNPPLASAGVEKVILDMGYTPGEVSKMVRTGDYPDKVKTFLALHEKMWGKHEVFDEPGLYWGVGKSTSASIPPYQSKNPEDLIMGALNPKAIPGIDYKYKQYIGNEIIQKEPGNILAKYGDIFKIIGLGGATTLGSQLIPDEAEASPIEGRIGKAMVKELGKTTGQSSAAKKLIGEVIDGKIVQDVLKGINKWRYILFEDGSRLPVRQNVLADIMKEKGTEKYMNILKEQETESSKLMQAYKSLQHHLQRQEPLVDKAAKEEWRKEYGKYMKEINQPEVPWTYIESHNVYLPEEYAKILEDAGVIQIKKGK